MAKVLNEEKQYVIEGAVIEAISETNGYFNMKFEGVATTVGTKVERMPSLKVGMTGDAKITGRQSTSGNGLLFFLDQFGELGAKPAGKGGGRTSGASWQPKTPMEVHAPNIAMIVSSAITAGNPALARTGVRVYYAALGQFGDLKQPFAEDPKPEHEQAPSGPAKGLVPNDPIDAVAKLYGLNPVTKARLKKWKAPAHEAALAFADLQSSGLNVEDAIAKSNANSFDEFCAVYDWRPH